MPLHTVEEAAELMKVSPDTVREWVRSGRLRASKLAGSKRCESARMTSWRFTMQMKPGPKKKKHTLERRISCA